MSGLAVNILVSLKTLIEHMMANMPYLLPAVTLCMKDGRHIPDGRMLG